MAERQLTVPFVGPDNRAGALPSAASSRPVSRRAIPIAILEGAPNAFNGIERTRGFQDAAREAGLPIVRSQTANWETARASQVVSALVAEQPGVKAILCGNDSMALGAVAALKAPDARALCSWPASTTSRRCTRLLMSGEIVATADQHGDQLAVYGIEYALQHLRRPAAALPDRETPRRPHHRRDAPLSAVPPAREWLGLAVALVLLVTGFSLATDHFFSWTTMVALANQAPEALLLATGHDASSCSPAASTCRWDRCSP